MKSRVNDAPCGVWAIRKAKTLSVDLRADAGIEGPEQRKPRAEVTQQCLCGWDFSSPQNRGGKTTIHRGLRPMTAHLWRKGIPDKKGTTFGQLKTDPYTKMKQQIQPKLTNCVTWNTDLKWKLYRCFVNCFFTLDYCLQKSCQSKSCSRRVAVGVWQVGLLINWWRGECGTFMVSFMGF